MQGSASAQGVFLLLLALAALLQLSSQTEYVNSGEDICRLFADGTKLRKPGYCDRWIVCKNHITQEGGKCENNKVFNLGRGACYNSLEVKDTYCKSPCGLKSNGYIGDTINCANWYYCEKSTTISKGICGNGMYFDQPSGYCVYPKDTKCNAKYELCQITPSGTKIRDEHDCSRYITCKSGTPTPTYCGDGLYFDVSTGNCIKKSLVNCKKHPYPDEACGNKKLAKRNVFVADRATCRGYYYCRDLGSGVPDPSPVWQQCPVETFFNEEIQLCQDRTARKCPEDRCDGRDSGFELAENPGCQNYIECKNGAEMQNLKCPTNTYFDVKTQKCTPEKKHYGVCSI